MRKLALQWSYLPRAEREWQMSSLDSRSISTSSPFGEILYIRDNLWFQGIVWRDGHWFIQVRNVSQWEVLYSLAWYAMQNFHLKKNWRLRDPFPKRITWNAFYGAGLWAVRERDVLLNDTVRPGKTEKGNLKQDSSKCVEVRDAKMALPLQNRSCVDSLRQLNATLALWLFSQKPYEWQSPQRPRRFPLVHLCLSSAWTNRLSGLWLYYGYSWAWELSWREFDNELLY